MGSYENAGGGYSLGGGYLDPTDIGAKHINQMMDHFYQSSYR